MHGGENRRIEDEKGRVKTLKGKKPQACFILHTRVLSTTKVARVIREESAERRKNIYTLYIEKERH